MGFKQPDDWPQHAAQLLHVEVPPRGTRDAAARLLTGIVYVLYEEMLALDDDDAVDLLRYLVFALEDATDCLVGADDE